MKQIQGGVTAAKGFEAAGVEAAIKYQNRKDMALIVSKAPCTVAGTFTSNVVKAAPVLWDKQIVEHSSFAQAVVVNSGIANACTGRQGLDCCEAEAKCAGELLGVPTDAVLVASTGVIGMQIPVDKITAGIKKLVTAKADTLEAGSDAAHAIMTTDTISKEIAIETEIGGKTVTLGGMCKGSGMIHPNMCTMLGFVTTDVNISKEMLQKCVSADVVDSFNMISVDGDTSTNDTLLVLANGMAGNEEITAEGEDYDNFCKALHEITTFLAKKMAEDGEQLGIVSSRDALKMAEEAGLDLVKIAPTAKPPVCKIVDYGKYKYEQVRKEKEAKKKQKVIDIKEIRLSPNIDTNDLNTKIGAARKFLTKGDRVKITLRFRGREMAHMNNSKHILDDIAQSLSDIAVVEKAPKVEGRSMTMFLTEKR